MSFPARCIVRVLICLMPFLFASCLGMSVPKDAKLEPPLASAGNPAFSGSGAIDKALVDRWELTHLVTDSGEKQEPMEGTRTLVEFTENGGMVMNRADKESPSVKKQTGHYSAEKNQLEVTDGEGRTSRWAYEVNGDTMVITMPEKKQKLYWRRYR